MCLWAYYNKILTYPIFYALKGDYSLLGVVRSRGYLRSSPVPESSAFIQPVAPTQTALTVKWLVWLSKVKVFFCGGTRCNTTSNTSPQSAHQHPGLPPYARHYAFLFLYSLLQGSPDAHLELSGVLQDTIGICGDYKGILRVRHF